MDTESPSWRWTVVERSEVPGRGVSVIGEHAGAAPVVGQACVIRDSAGSVDAVVAGLERFHHREDGKFSHHSWGLLLREVAPDAVRTGAVVEYDGRDATP
jgi:translation elongation factor EF-Tu-like GTPase